MCSAFAVTGIWAVSTFASARGAQHLGGISANLVRIALAILPLTLGALLLGLTPWTTLHYTGANWFLLSGVVGMGVCDILALQAYARLGARIPSLVVNVTAPLTAATIGWLWLAERLGAREALALVTILTGVVLVLRPRAAQPVDRLGLCYAAASGATFAGATVMSRLGYRMAAEAGAPIHWLDATILRLAAGLLFTMLAFALTSVVARAWRDGPGRWRQALPWLAVNAMLGPSLGMAIFQYALLTNTAHAVHAIVATLPVFVMLLAWCCGSERPDRTGVGGTVLSVLGVMALILK